MVDFLFLANPVIDEVALIKAMTPEWAAPLLQQCADQFATCEWNHDALKHVVESTGETHGVKLGKAQAPVRVAVTGRSVGPPLFESIELLGREVTIQRLHSILTR
jgi:glutamyl-tRNA synthetase